jgi:CRISPR system Cascade subunit CasB
VTATDTQAPQPTVSTPKIPVAQIVHETVNARIAELQSGYLKDRPDAVGALARIRRGAGKPINAVPDLWGLTVTDALYAKLDGKAWPGELEKAENGVHIAVTLWALHQQSRRDTPMHVAGGPQLGRAVRALMPGGEIDEPVRQRFVRMGTATSLDVLAQRARDIVLLLRREAQPMDYGMLAEQLYRWQLPNGRLKVHQDWGRNFHANRPAGADAPADPDTTGKDPS